MSDNKWNERFVAAVHAQGWDVIEVREGTDLGDDGPLMGPWPAVDNTVTYPVMNVIAPKGWKPDPMTREKAIAKLKALAGSGDVEAAHGNADDVLCELLRSLGYGDVVNAWDEVEKWYA